MTERVRESSTLVRFRVLGPVEYAGGVTGSALGGRRQRSLLAVLIARAGEVVTGDGLVEAVWGEAAPSRPLSSVQTYVSSLRRVIAERIEYTGVGYRLEAPPQAVDAAVFERLLVTAQTELERDPTVATDLLDQALSMWRGSAFEDVADAPGLRLDAGRLDALRVVALEARMRAGLACGDTTGLAARMEPWLEPHMLRESFVALFVSVLAAEERQAEALRVIDKTRTRLREELGVSLGPSLQELEDSLLHQDPEVIGVRSARRWVSGLYRPPSADRPTGAVTFLFTDIEGSTLAWDQAATEMDQALEVHDRVLSGAIESNGGYVFATAGDSYSAAFSSPTSALSAAVAAQRGLIESGCGLRVRMGVHSGEAIERDGNYFGPALNQTARITSIGHGGQVLVSETTKGLVAVADFEFLDLGEHRLADLSTPVRLSQLVADGLEQSLPPLRSVLPTNNLPLLGEVFGRSTDIDRITDLLNERRLVTLTGAGGIGKTTLATSVAMKMVEPFPDGRWLVDLTDLQTDSDRNAVSGKVVEVDDRFGSVEALAHRRMLLILDNCEHILDGVRGYVDDLLATTPDVTVLATSREPLGLRGEKTFPVDPLSVDDDSDRASAVDLFVDRAEEAGVTFELDTARNTISSICRKVGGLPLAIELAAARAAVMTPEQILDRLSDRLSVLRGGRGGPEHHRTIEATIAWSYDLLNDDAQKLLRFLSVFEGGFDLQQAEAIGEATAVDRLADLVRKNLIHRHDNRFGMLEAVRQYASTRLTEAGEEMDAHGRHFEFFAKWAHNVYQRDGFIDPTLEEIGWMTLNLQGLRRAVEWGAENGDATLAGEIAAVLTRHQQVVLLGKPVSINYFEPLMKHLEDLDPQLHMAVLNGSAGMAHWSGAEAIAASSEQGLPPGAKEKLTACYEIHRRTGLVPRTGALPQVSLGIVSYVDGNWDEAERWYREATAFAEQTGLPHHQAASNLAELLRDVRDDPTGALSVLERARLFDDAVPDSVRVQNRLEEAAVRVHAGEVAEPRSLTTNILASLRQEGIMAYQQGWSLVLLSMLEHRDGDLRASATLMLESLELESAEETWPIWRHHEALYLAELLIDINEPTVAERLLAEFESSPIGRMRLPGHESKLRRLEERIARFIDPGRPKQESSDSLAEAIHDALLESIRT